MKRETKLRLLFVSEAVRWLTCPKSKYILDDFAEKLADIAVVDKPSKVEGRSMVMFLTAKR